MTTDIVMFLTVLWIRIRNTFWPGRIWNNCTGSGFGSGLFDKKICINFEIFLQDGPIRLRFHTYFRRKSLKCFKKSWSSPWLCTLNICQLFSWPGVQHRIRIRIRNDTKSRIRIRTKSFRSHNTRIVSILQYWTCWEWTHNKLLEVQNMDKGATASLASTYEG